jgi:predicted metal-dependent HD superfamily phosphohydrolase
VTRADRWLDDLAGASGLAADELDRTTALAVLRDLEDRHAEPVRRYHTIVHVDAVLEVLDELIAAAPPDEARTGDVVALAAWFHDAIYDPTRMGNEAASASLATDALTRLGLDDDVVTEVTRLIELTAGHQLEPGDLAGALLVDADLSILGTDPATYDRYAEQIRMEYGHVPFDAYRVGRADVLAGFLARPQLFHTASARVRWEQQARANLERERSALLTASP